MARTVTVEHNRQQFVWNGRGWYDAREYTVPPEALSRELDKLLPEDVRAKVLAEIAEENERHRQQTLVADRRRVTQTLRERAMSLSRHEDLLRDWVGREPTYEELLSTCEWHERRADILVRDQFQCQDCGCYGIGAGPKALQVHHRHYILNKLPWDYPDDDLVTLCLECHTKRHEAGKVLVYEEVGGQLVRRNLRPCIRCLGAGFFPQWEHIEAGVCFRCGGARFDVEVFVKER